MKPQWSHHHRRLLFYVDTAPYTTPSSPLYPTIPLSRGHPLPLLSPPFSSTRAADVSRRTIHHPPPLVRPAPLSPAPTLDSSIAVTIMVLISALFFMGFFSIYLRRFTTEDSPSYAGTNVLRRRPAPTPGHLSSCSRIRRGLDPAIISSLPSHAYDGTAKYFQVDCPVCLSEFEEGEVVKAIPHCGHVFHVQCIDRWLHTHVSCPVCRTTRLLEAKPSAAGSAEVSRSPTVAEAEGDARCPGSVEQETLRAVTRCSSWSHLWREEPGARRGSLYRTRSF
ncbi:hypothetical protein SAY87_016612 [Trapa incisa]|uniref:RING-type E3 ubiquitin transferase n=1 Tax=Trapa incisa TaxID=236973 RepID=A0AAN7L743_9MYRT|nr:hypothetical protein SAY87_016612 [Trapa incisa]